MNFFFQLISEPSRIRLPDEIDTQGDSTTYPDSDNSIVYPEPVTFNCQVKKRMYDKKHCCYFCNKYNSKLLYFFISCFITYVHKSIVMSITCTVEPLYCDIPWGRKMMSLYRGFQEGAQLPFKYM